MHLCSPDCLPVHLLKGAGLHNDGEMPSKIEKLAGQIGLKYLREFGDGKVLKFKNRRAFRHNITMQRSRVFLLCAVVLALLSCMNAEEQSKEFSLRPGFNEEVTVSVVCFKAEKDHNHHPIHLIHYTCYLSH